MKGTGNFDGTVEILGLRKRDKKSSITAAKIVAVDPQYSSPSEDKEIYIGEKYIFDSRVKDVDQDRISVQISGSAVNKKHLIPSKQNLLQKVGVKLFLKHL